MILVLVANTNTDSLHLLELNRSQSGLSDFIFISEQLSSQKKFWDVFVTTFSDALMRPCSGRRDAGSRFAVSTHHVVHEYSEGYQYHCKMVHARMDIT